MESNFSLEWDSQTVVDMFRYGKVFQVMRIHKMRSVPGHGKYYSVRLDRCRRRKDMICPEQKPFTKHLGCDRELMVGDLLFQSDGQWTHLRDERGADK